MCLEPPGIRGKLAVSFMPTFRELYDLFVFDLDGTLADTREDLARSVNQALSTLGLPPLSLEAVTRYVGDGARALIERALGLPTSRPGGPRASGETVDRALKTFLDDYREACVKTTKLYPEVRPALEALKGKDLAVLTNKPLYPTRKILAALGIEGLFRKVVGGDSFPEKKPDPSGLCSIAEEAGHSFGRTLLVGDSSIDVRTARAAGAKAAFVTYGFKPDDWRITPPDHVLSSFSMLLGDAP